MMAKKIEFKIDEPKETSLIGVSLAKSEELQKQGFMVVAIYTKDGLKVHDLMEVKK